MTPDDLRALADRMRSAADELDAISAHYNTVYHVPARHQSWSAVMLREEADELERGL